MGLLFFTKSRPKAKLPKLLPHFLSWKTQKMKCFNDGSKKNITGPLTSTKLHMNVSKILFKSNRALHSEALFLHFAFDPGDEFRYFCVNPCRTFFSTSISKAYNSNLVPSKIIY